jgi:methionyl aminopeptidase
MIVIKDSAALEKMRVSGQVCARVRDKVLDAISPGVTTKEVSDYAGELIRGFGAESAFLGYKGFPGQICVSVNDAVVHGIPGPKKVQVGDIVSVDIGVRFGGYIGDSAATIMVGVTDQDVIRLVRTAERALQAGIAAAVPGKRVSDISHAIEQVAAKAGFSVVRQFVGHGIGKKMHEDPQVPNFGAPGHGPRLKPGMTLAIEPMINMGTHEVEIQEDGWTVLTKDRKPSAHFEHTVAVREGAAEILTP